MIAEKKFGDTLAHLRAQRYLGRVAKVATERERKAMLYEALIILAPFAVAILAMAMGADITDSRWKEEEK